LTKHVTIYTDGACSGNPGPGGWAAVLRYGAHERVLTGHAAETTNNRMELTAVVAALAALTEPVAAAVHTDSANVANAFIARDIWVRLRALARRIRVRFVEVMGCSEDALIASKVRIAAAVLSEGSEARVES